MDEENLSVLTRVLRARGSAREPSCNPAKCASLFEFEPASFLSEISSNFLRGRGSLSDYLFLCGHEALYPKTSSIRKYLHDRDLRFTPPLDRRPTHIFTPGNIEYTRSHDIRMS